MDNNIYPIVEGKNSDDKNRPIGIGVQGLSDVFIKLRLSFTSDEAKRINKNIFETIYYASLTASKDLARVNGPYKTYGTSMVANGILQFDLWNVVPDSGLWDWNFLKSEIKKYGIYNSLLVALMPTASTASIMGSIETVEPITSNMYVRSVLSGTFQIVNKYLINDLIELKLWNNILKQKIIANNGSIQNIEEIPQQIKDIYKTIWEYKLSELINMDADRGAFVCQTSSSNKYISNIGTNALTKLHIYTWRRGLKTSSYYIRSKSSNEAVKFTVDPNIIKEMNKQQEARHVMYVVPNIFINIFYINFIIFFLKKK